jgi:hypothetical protein
VETSTNASQEDRTENSGFLLLPFGLILLLIDSIAISSYIYMHLPHLRAKLIFYVILVSIALGLLALSIFYAAHP